ncbi:MAG TPA: hypothetical protein VG367_17360 [Mucilaginibacter sp.]|jgi:hypothetical protein|nr:hypothetical protein [Mucilaginibacter sp.]
MTNELLNQFLESLKTDIINSLQANGKVATGRTAQQIAITNDGNTAQLQIPAHIQLLETGRGPTSANPVPGNPPMIERIKAWCQAKGIPDQAVWAIKKSIDKKGFKGVPGILSEPLSEDNINLRLDPAAEELANAVAQQIIDTIGLS